MSALPAKPHNTLPTIHHTIYMLHNTIHCTYYILHYTFYTIHYHWISSVDSSNGLLRGRECMQRKIGTIVRPLPLCLPAFSHCAVGVFDMPNPYRYNILSISIFCKIPLSISMFSRMSLGVIHKLRNHFWGSR